METHAVWLLASGPNKAVSVLSQIIHGHNQRFHTFFFFFFFLIAIAFSLSACVTITSAFDIAPIQTGPQSIVFDLSGNTLNILKKRNYFFIVLKMAITSKFNSEFYFIPTCHFVFKSLSEEWNQTTLKHLIAVNLLDIRFSVFLIIPVLLTVSKDSRHSKTRKQCRFNTL